MSRWYQPKSEASAPLLMFINKRARMTPEQRKVAAAVVKSERTYHGKSLFSLIDQAKMAARAASVGMKDPPEIAALRAARTAAWERAGRKSPCLDQNFLEMHEKLMVALRQMKREGK